MSCLTLERLLFDPTDPTNSPIVGSYLLGSSGAVITDTTPGVLDVNIANAISVDIDGIYNVSTNANPDNVGLIGHTRAATPGDSDQVERITVAAASADNVPEANIHAMDVNSFLMGYDSGASQWDRLKAIGGVLEVNISSLTNALQVVGNVADDAVDSGNPLLVGGHAYDQSTALGALSAAGDRGYVLMDLYRRVFVNDAPNRAVACVNTAVTDTVGGTQLVATELAGRTRIMIQNVGTEPVYIGPSGVTTSSGLRVDKGATLSLEAGEAIAFYAIAPATKTVNCRIFELA